MAATALGLKIRDPQIKPKYVRASGRIPAIFYGHNQKNLLCEVNYNDFLKVFREVGESALLDLSIDADGTKQEQKALIHDVQYDSLRGDVIHVDFIHVDMKEMVQTRIPLEFVGVSSAVKDKSGILTIVKHELEIKCLPQYLVSKITVDISPLVDFHVSIRIKDINLPEGIKCLHNDDDAVVTVSQPQREEEVKPAVAAAVPVEGAAAAAPAAGDKAAASAEEKGKKDKKE